MTAIGLVSIKGGVGKTTATVNLATALSELGRKVLVIDANLTGPSVGLSLGLVQPALGLQDVLAGRARAGEAITRLEHFELLPASLFAAHYSVDPARLRRLVERLKPRYDVLLLDSGAGPELAAVMAAADELLVITNPDYLTLACTLHAVKLARERDVPITGLLLNRVRKRRFELSLEEIEDATGVPVLAVLPEDIAVSEALAHTQPVLKFRPRRTLSVEYRALAAALVGESYRDARLLPRLLRVFTDRIPRQEINRVVLRDARTDKP